MSEPASTPERNPKEGARPENKTRVIGTDQLFQGAREVCIEHDGVRYRLRITRRNKLILQK
jgi:hemin uptake protein HemP